MSRSGIGLVDEGLADVLARSSSEACRRGLAAGIHLALERTGLSDQRLDRAVEALSAGRLGDGAERSAVLALVEELDEAAWDLQDRVEAGTADHADYLREFARARAAAAVGFAFDRDALVASSEGLYEAFHAVGDASSLRRAVLGALDDGSGRP